MNVLKLYANLGKIPQLWHNPMECVIEYDYINNVAYLSLSNYYALIVNLLNFSGSEDHE